MLMGQFSCTKNIFCWLGAGAPGLPFVELNLRCILVWKLSQILHWKTLPYQQLTQHSDWGSENHPLYFTGFVTLVHKFDFLKNKAYFSDYYKNQNSFYIWNKIFTENKLHIGNKDWSVFSTKMFFLQNAPAYDGAPESRKKLKWHRLKTPWM